MREILFRGKDLQEHNGWLYGYFYKSDISKRERESGKATLIFTPNCDSQKVEEVFIERFKYCRDCGQALDWSDNDD